MLTIDCKDVSSVQNELLVYVADKVEDTIDDVEISPKQLLNLED